MIHVDIIMLHVVMLLVGIKKLQQIDMIYLAVSYHVECRSIPPYMSVTINKEVECIISTGVGSVYVS